MILLISDHAGSDLRKELSPVSNNFPSFEQALEVAYRFPGPVLAVSESGNSFQIAANKYYRDFPAVSIRSTKDIDDGLDYFARLFEIPSNLELDLAGELLMYLGDKS